MLAQPLYTVLLYFYVTVDYGFAAKGLKGSQRLSGFKGFQRGRVRARRAQALREASHEASGCSRRCICMSVCVYACVRVRVYACSQHLVLGAVGALFVCAASRVCAYTS